MDLFRDYVRASLISKNTRILFLEFQPIFMGHGLSEGNRHGSQKYIVINALLRCRHSADAVVAFGGACGGSGPATGCQSQAAGWPRGPTPSE